MGIAPNPLYPEKGSPGFDLKYAVTAPGMKGPLRFEEGVATDTDVPTDFIRGAYRDTASLAGHLNRVDPMSIRKFPEETMRERAHVGSASWIEAPTMLSDFVQGASAGQTPPQWERVMNPGTRQARRAATVVFD